MYLGLDFGTTNSAIALFDGDQLITVHSDPANENPLVTPSLVYIDRKHRTQIGAAAAHTYLERETGRVVQWRQRKAGELNITVASFEGDPIDFFETVHVMVDVAARGKLLQSIKTTLFNDRYDGTQIFGRYYRVENLIATVLRWLKVAAERQFGQPVEKIVMGRPVRFSARSVIDSRSESILFKAAHLAGFKAVSFMLEPVGVAFLQHRASPTRQTGLIFDFGGGTLDLTIAHVGGTTPPEILATRGVIIGGDDLDRRIMESLFNVFGADVNSDDAVLPPDMTDKLRTWQTMPELSRPRHMIEIKRLQRTSRDPQPFYALETLVTHNLGFQLFKEIERVKKQLSSEISATLSFKHEDIHIERTFNRRRFERLIANEVELVQEGINHVLAGADLKPCDIDVVLRTGGTSLVPAFGDLLESIFGTEKLVDIDPLVSVVGGFAIAAYEGIGRKPPPASPDTVFNHISLTSGAIVETYHIDLHVPCFSDRDFVISRIPPMLHRLPALRLPNHDYENTDMPYLCFDLVQPARLYIAYDTGADRTPDWLRTFTAEPMHIEIDDEFAKIRRMMQVYSRDFPSGALELGGNQSAGYSGTIPVHYLVLAAV